MPLQLNPLTPSSQPVADCDAIGTMLRDARAKYQEIAGDPVVIIDSHARTVTAALSDEAAERARAVQKIEAALDQSGGTLVRLSTEAVRATSDLFVAFAIQRRDPRLLGIAVGADLLVDTGHFVIQIVTAKDDTTVQEAAAIFSQDRYTLIQSLVSGPGGKFTRKRMEMAKATTDLIQTLGEAVLDEVALQRKLRAAKAALDDIEGKIAGLPVSHGEWQQYMLNQLDAEIFVLDLLNTEYAGSDCQVAPVLPIG